MKRNANINVNGNILEGGCKFMNNSDIEIKVKYYGTNSKNLSKYRIYIEGKKIVYPTESYPEKNKGIIFIDCKTIIINMINTEILQLAISTQTSTILYYINKISLIDDIAYDLYNYIPSAMSKTNVAKCLDFVRNYPDLKCYKAVYNIHGFVALCINTKHNGYSVLYSKPLDLIPQLIPCSEINIDSDGSCNSKSSNNFVNFRYIASNGLYYINSDFAHSVY